MVANIASLDGSNPTISWDFKTPLRVSYQRDSSESLLDTCYTWESKHQKPGVHSHHVVSFEHRLAHLPWRTASRERHPELHAPLRHGSAIKGQWRVLSVLGNLYASRKHLHKNGQMDCTLPRLVDHPSLPSLQLSRRVKLSKPQKQKHRSDWDQQQQQCRYNGLAIDLFQNVSADHFSMEAQFQRGRQQLETPGL